MKLHLGMLSSSQDLYPGGRPTSRQQIIEFVSNDSSGRDAKMRFGGKAMK